MLSLMMKIGSSGTVFTFRVWTNNQEITSHSLLLTVVAYSFKGIFLKDAYN